jgi:SAM-dependent methyltransferase
MADRWNHNLHYQQQILGAVPSACGTALDVGCGDGSLARLLARRCPDVTGIDLDETMIDIARRGTSQRFIHHNFLTYPFMPGSFDFVCANTSLHHMDFAKALHKLAEILRPGGRLAVIGLGKDQGPADWAISAVAVVPNLAYRARYGYAQNPAMPVLEADMTWAQCRATATQVLPGVRYRRLLLWRYFLLWDKPRDTR